MHVNEQPVAVRDDDLFVYACRLQSRVPATLSLFSDESSQTV